MIKYIKYIILAIIILILLLLTQYFEQEYTIYSNREYTESKGNTDWF